MLKKSRRWAHILAVLLSCFWSVHLIAQNPAGTLVPPDKLVEDTTGQRDLIGIALKLVHIHIKKPPKVAGQRVYYSIVPLGGSVPEGGEAFITSTNAAFE